MLQINFLGERFKTEETDFLVVPFVPIKTTHERTKITKFVWISFNKTKLNAFKISTILTNMHCSIMVGN